MSPHRRSGRFGTLLVMVAVALLVSVPVQAAARGDAPPRWGAATPAKYGDRVIDLTSGWEGARACVVWPGVLDQPECFDAEAEMNRRIAELEAEMSASVGSSGGGIAATTGASCASYLRLYDGTWYTGAVLYLRGRGQWFNLADYGFDQRTSSYVIGACSAWFADWRNGGGSWYPTSLTEAYDTAPSMLSGWDNDVSSVYIT